MDILETMRENFRRKAENISLHRISVKRAEPYIAPALLMISAIATRMGNAPSQLHISPGRDNVGTILENFSARDGFRLGSNPNSDGEWGHPDDDGGWGIAESFHGVPRPLLGQFVNPKSVENAVLKTWAGLSSASFNVNQLRESVMPSGLTEDELRDFLREVMERVSARTLRGFMFDPVGCVTMMGWSNPVDKAAMMMSLLHDDNRVSVRDRDLQTGRTALHEWVDFHPFTRADSLRLLLENGADIDAEDATGCTPMHIASQKLLELMTSQHSEKLNPTEIWLGLDLVRKLREAGARADIPDEDDNTAAEYLTRALEMHAGTNDERLRRGLDEIRKELAFMSSTSEPTRMKP